MPEKDTYRRFEIHSRLDRRLNHGGLKPRVSLPFVLYQVTETTAVGDGKDDCRGLHFRNQKLGQARDRDNK